ncbi:DUF3846 domain-containing protein [Proteiniborus sp. MB09-C3]|uniref:DUF3846 domain-containing protein n=1 Tax=Proteiniborus sp. MB09-C3 TaxID=3050072 RepID=UPI002557BEC7|nr:DUF3846 domain-containing protein [Proteiniborus sp. MB09-C3]WIV13228.1 DUF3846 domain-containing protein [Proteiniborus sp. MB09-C3]
MKVVYIEPNKNAEIREIGSRLEDMQGIVGGSIEMTRPFNDPVAIISNDEGKLMGLEPNRGLTYNNGELYDIIVGTFFICLARPDSEDFESLTDELASKYLKMFYESEKFMVVNGVLLSFKCDTEHI